MPSEPAQSLPDHCSCAAPGIPQAAIDAMIAAAAEPIHDDGHTDCYYAGLLIAALPYVSPETARLRAENEALRETLKLIAEADVELFTGKPQRPSGEFCVNAAKRALALDEQEATG